MTDRPPSRAELFAWSAVGACFAAIALHLLARALDAYLTVIQSLPARAVVPGGVGCLT